MPAVIKESEIKWHDPIRISFGFTGFTAVQAVSIMRAIVDESWPDIRRPAQCVYVIRLFGDIAIDYPRGFSPVMYVGEGDAYRRLTYHIVNWLSPLVASIYQTSIEIRIAEVTRRNNNTLYQYIEADLLRWFVERHDSLPWFNRQRERGKESHYEYEHEAELSLKKHLGVGTGNTFLWAIKPTHNNDQFDSYDKGMHSEE